MQESIYIASKDVYESLIKAKKEGVDLKTNTHLEVALTKYLSIMSTLCKPFGLFTKCSIGKFEDGNNILFGNLLKRHTRFDNENRNSKD